MAAFCLELIELTHQLGQRTGVPMIDGVGVRVIVEVGRSIGGDAPAPMGR